MKQGLQWYKREPIAFLDGVQGMGPELIGTYAVLLDLIYARGGDTPRDDRHLAGVLGCSVRKARALTDKLIEAGKIWLDGEGVIRNSRAENEMKSRRNERETLVKQGRNGGEKSGRVRKNKNLAEAIREDKSREEGVSHHHRKDSTAARENHSAGHGGGGDSEGAFPSSEMGDEPPPPGGEQGADGEVCDPADQLLDEVAAAAGIADRSAPGFEGWRGEKARNTAKAWLDLDRGTLLSAVAHAAAGLSEPPAVPWYFEKPISRATASASPAPPTASPAQQRARERFERRARIAAELDLRFGHAAPESPAQRRARERMDRDARIAAELDRRYEQARPPGPQAAPPEPEPAPAPPQGAPPNELLDAAARTLAGKSANDLEGLPAVHWQGDRALGEASRWSARGATAADVQAAAAPWVGQKMVRPADLTNAIMTLAMKETKHAD